MQPAAIVIMVYRCAGYLAGALRLVSALCVALMASITMAEIVLRYFSIPLPWANEAARTLFLWSVMLGIAVTTWLKSHIAVELLEKSRSTSVQYVVRLIAFLAILILSLLLAVEGASFAATNLTNYTAALQISLSIATSSICVGGIFMTIFSGLILLEELFPSCRMAGEAARAKGFES